MTTLREALGKVKITQQVTCPYCGSAAELVSGDRIYQHRQDLRVRKFWLCESCDAYVGCHKGREPEPLGSLANAELREARKAAHTAFDRLWKYKGMSRTAAYMHLASELGIPYAECHIGSFDVETCETVVEISYDWET